MSSDDSGETGTGPQLRIWENASRRQSLGRLEDGDESWEVHLVVERAASDLYRGRLAFHRNDDYLVTAAIIVEESEAGVVARAEELPESMMHQFLMSVRA